MSLREPKANFPLEEVLNCLLTLGTLGRKLVCLEYLVSLRVWNKNYLVATKMIFHNLFVTGSLHALFNRLEKHKVNLIQAGVQFHFAFSSKLHFYKLLVDLWCRFPEIWMLQLNKQQARVQDNTCQLSQLSKTSTAGDLDNDRTSHGQLVIGSTTTQCCKIEKKILTPSLWITLSCLLIYLVFFQ